MKHDLQAIKDIPIGDVLSYLGFEFKKSGAWLHIKGDDSFKANHVKNFYHDYGSNFSKGSTIDLVMNTQNIDFKEACNVLASHFLGVITDNTFTPKQAIKAPKKAPTMAKKYIAKNITDALLSAIHYERNNFVSFLKSQYKATNEAINNLNIGTSKDGLTVFLFQNSEGNYEAVKMIGYGKDAKRTSQIEVPKGFTMSEGYEQTCFFNERVIESAKIIFVVESEKTAAIATLFFDNPDYGFIATGGANRIESLLKNKATILSEKRVILLPDNDEAGDTWIILPTAYKANYDDLSALSLDVDAPNKYDLADFILYDTNGAWRSAFDKKVGKEVPKKAALPKMDFSFLDDVVVSKVAPLPAPLPAPAKQTFDMVGANNIIEKPYVEVEVATPLVEQAKILLELEAFFDAQVLPEKILFTNEFGKVYETLNNPKNSVETLLIRAKEALNRQSKNLLDTYIYQLQKIQKSLTSGEYLKADTTTEYAAEYTGEHSDVVPF
jgi:hypothetical protein